MLYIYIYIYVVYIYIYIYRVFKYDPVSHSTRSMCLTKWSSPWVQPKLILAPLFPYTYTFVHCSRIEIIRFIRICACALLQSNAAKCKHEACPTLRNFMIAGTVIERGSDSNNGRFLVHFDDGHCRYYPLSELFRIFEPSAPRCASCRVVPFETVSFMLPSETYERGRRRVKWKTRNALRSTVPLYRTLYDSKSNVQFVSQSLL